jgi:hypothetical protein
VIVTIFLLSGVLWSHSGMAEICPGTIRGSLINPLPSPLRVHPGKPIAEFNDPGLARRFFGGMQQEGISVAKAGNARLTTTFSIIAPRSYGLPGGSQPGFDWASNGHRIRSADLVALAILSDDREYTHSWLVTIECKIATDDPGALAEYLGRTVGRSIGKDIDEKTM